MVKKIMEIGNKIEMYEISAKKADDEQKIVYVSQVLEFDDDDDDMLKIAMPIYEGRLIPLQVGRKFNLCFYTTKGLYTADCVIEARRNVNNIYMLDVRLSSEIKKYQRRQYYRLDCNYEIKYKIIEQSALDYREITGNLPGYVEHEPFLAATALDISGGGMRFVTKQDMQKGEVIMLGISYTADAGEKYIEVLANVISAAAAKNNTDVFEIRVNYIDITENVREDIIKFIFSEQRKKMKKESGLS